MVSFTYLAGVAVLSLINAVNAGPDTNDWGKHFSYCYSGGNQWEGGGGVIKAHMRNACFGWNGNRGYYQDVYYQPWLRSPYSNKLCVNTGASHINVEIANLNPTAGFTLKNDDEYRILEYLINSCSHGGEYQDSGWWYRIDPNAGFC